MQACLSKHLAEERERAGAHLIIPLEAEDGIRERSLVGGKAAGLFPVDLARPLLKASASDWELVRWIEVPKVDDFLGDLRRKAVAIQADLDWRDRERRLR